MLGYFRYVDDTLIVLSRSKANVHDMFNAFNNTAKFIIHHGTGIKQQNQCF